MTTTTVPIQITCPDWCTVSPDEHVAQLWTSGGVCFHHAPDIEVTDPTGHLEELSEPRFYGPICLSLTTTTNPEGRETASPVFRIDDAEHSLAQLLALADTIQTMAALYQGEAMT